MKQCDGSLGSFAASGIVAAKMPSCEVYSRSLASS